MNRSKETALQDCPDETTVALRAARVQSKLHAALLYALDQTINRSKEIALQKKNRILDRL
jgi:hypothetical protein